MSDSELLSAVEAEAERDARIFKLRLAGASARTLAKQFTLRPREIDEIVEAKMIKVDARYKAAAQALDIERLESLIGKLLSMAHGGDIEAASAAIRALARRAAILGYDSPQRIDATLEVIRPETSTDYYQRVLAELKAQNALPADAKPN